MKKICCWAGLHSLISMKVKNLSCIYIAHLGFLLWNTLLIHFCPYFSLSCLLFAIDLYFYILDNYLLPVIYMRTVSCCVVCIFLSLLFRSSRFNVTEYTSKFA